MDKSGTTHGERSGVHLPLLQPQGAEDAQHLSPSLALAISLPLLWGSLHLLPKCGSGLVHNSMIPALSPALGQGQDPGSRWSCAGRVRMDLGKGWI